MIVRVIIMTVSCKNANFSFLICFGVVARHRMKSAQQNK
jgi:hypothetical protein